jgi:hypothetical protein
MTEGEHLIYFSSRHSDQDKVTGSFTVNLPYTLNLEGDWKCAVLDFFLSPDNSESDSNQYIYILGDFCNTSFIRDKQIPILHKISLRDGLKQYTPSHLLYISLKQNSLTDFDLTFLDPSLRPVILTSSGIIECTLHLIKHG